MAKIEKNANDFIQSQFGTKLRWYQYQVTGGYVALFILFAILWWYLERKRYKAFRGNASAARKLILPAFKPLLVVTTVVSFGYSCYFLVRLLLDICVFHISTVENVLMNAGREFIALLVIVFMWQKNLTLPSLVMAIVQAFVVCVYIIPVLSIMTALNADMGVMKWVYHSSKIVVLLLYAIVFVRPPVRATTRVLREYCVYSMIYVSLDMVYSELFLTRQLKAAINVALGTMIWSSFYPFLIYRLLRADTTFWRGIGDRANVLDKFLRQKQLLSETLSSEGLHLLIDLHRKHIIDFAFLHIKAPIGRGTHAVVFRGTLNTTCNVAVKVYTPPEWTDDIIADFSNETALCGALQHPNIVTFYGMCISPPNICLVSELCAGNLMEFIKAQARRKRQVSHHCQLGYILDIARAIAYLHSFTPSFVHRDIKPENFVVSKFGVVKLTDFGESRSLPQENESIHNKDALHVPQMVFTENETPFQVLQSPGGAQPWGNMLTIRGTVEYMAPEIMNAQSGVALYNEKADIYSFAITMWDILHPLAPSKYPTIKNRCSTYDAVLGGTRPVIDASIDYKLRDILERCWVANPVYRPTAAALVEELEALQRDNLIPVALLLQRNLHFREQYFKLTKKVTKSFLNEGAVKCLLSKGVVCSKKAALRLGNALLDHGWIHHVKHSRSFEYPNSHFTMDQKKLELYRHYSHDRPKSPGSNIYIDICDESSPFSTSFTETSDPWVSSSLQFQDTYSEKKECKCKKLGQGFYRKSVHRRAVDFLSTTPEDDIMTSTHYEQEDYFPSFS